MPSVESGLSQNRDRTIKYSLFGGTALSGLVALVWGLLFYFAIGFGPEEGIDWDIRSTGVMIGFFVGLLALMGVSAWIGAVTGLAFACKRDNSDLAIHPDKRRPTLTRNQRIQIERQRSLVSPGISREEQAKLRLTYR
ncbi:MAG: hypothetical protein H7144_17810 [Burkholderiales bacterium]|nr:hypothetical protein [Phycisphaerae bacterium]